MFKALRKFFGGSTSTPKPKKVLVGYKYNYIYKIVVSADTLDGKKEIVIERPNQLTTAEVVKEAEEMMYLLRHTDFVIQTLNVEIEKKPIYEVEDHEGTQ